MFFFSFGCVYDTKEFLFNPLNFMILCYIFFESLSQCKINETNDEFGVFVIAEISLNIN